LEAKIEQEQQQENNNNTENNSPETEQEQQKSSYKPDDKEKHLYHVQLEKPLYNPSSGKKMSTPYIQKFTKNEFKQFVGKKGSNDKSNAEMLGYTVKVLFNPEENMYY
jgi:hypothetical protein